MAAKRLGSVLTNITGTAGQLLRVKTDESGFEFYTPTGLPTYTITNDTTDRAIDADVTTIDELADVVSTLIKDITTLVGGPVAFQWSTSEQVYPFEKGSNGETLYAKQVTISSFPNNGSQNYPHGISGLGSGTSRVKQIWGVVYRGNGLVARPMPYAHANGQYTIELLTDETNIIIGTGSNYFALDGSGYVRLIYSK
jgi:hypothetical protein